MQKRYSTTFRRTCPQPSQRDQLLASAAARAVSWFVYRGMANAVACDAHADYIDSQIEAWLALNLPQRSDPPPRFDLWQRYDNLASKEADEFWSAVLALIIEGPRH
jgi:hypothetical protein